MSAATKRLVVCGGNGFLGSRICKYAVARGWDVTSISRSGEPKWETVTNLPIRPSWAHAVTWEKADILKPATYTSILHNANYVVHSMGILLEADYKNVIRGAESPISGLRRAFSSSKRGSQNPLDRRPSTKEELKSQEPDGQITYELMNRDSVVMLAKEAANQNVPVFGYISAAGGAPVIPARYLSTKREAEALITKEFPGMRSFFVRAPFMFDSSRTLSVPLAGMAGLGAAFNTVTGGTFGGLLGMGGVKPLKVDVVAEAVVEALVDDSVQGPLQVERIEDLACKAWRKGML
ncbi:hypothetical protein F5884DRAFT_450256 [Xylogone sp. PMI_703]|nr:hypothetical protein F5884DRAFT_450256 [Xylogone sp. PMI_703]